MSLQVTYGMLDKYKDVTEEVYQHFVNDSNQIVFKAGTEYNNFFGDPCPGFPKEIKLSINNQVRVIGEYDTQFNEIVIDLDNPMFDEPSEKTTRASRKIVDCFMIGDELDLLIARLKYLNEAIDYFVIAESERTHQNQPKECVVKKFMQNPPEWLDPKKVILVTLTGQMIDDNKLFDQRIAEHGDQKMVWGIENQQRECLSQGVDELFNLNLIKLTDLIILSDLDEYPDRDILKHTRTHYQTRIIFYQSCHNYSFRWLTTQKWCGSILFEYANYQKKFIPSFQKLRDYRFGFSPITIHAGWHCSYFGGPKRITNKLKNIVEGPAFYHDCDKFSDSMVDDIKSKIMSGKDLYGRSSNVLHSNHDWTNLPPFALEIEPDLENYLVDLEKYAKICIYDAVAVHGFVFKDIRESLLESFSRLDYSVELMPSLENHSAENLYLILGLHVLSNDQLPQNFIAYQLEQLPHSPLVEETYLDNLRQALRVWDYSQTNIEWLHQKGIEAVYCPVSYSPCLEVASPTPKTKGQVVFYGSLNDRRRKMLAILEMNGISVKYCKNTCWGSARNQLMTEASIVLNWHYFDDGLMELSRLAPLLSNRVFIISEKAKESEINEILKDGMVLVDNLDELVIKIKYYLRLPEEAREIADKGYEIFREKFNFIKRLPIVHHRPVEIFDETEKEIVEINQKTIAFQSNQLSERGTEVALFDYADYNEKLLGNRSIILSQRNSRFHNQATIKSFQERFPVFFYDQWDEVDQILIDQKTDALYMIKSGENDGQISKVVKNLVHCVFNLDSPHGQVYIPISPCVRGYRPNGPWLPHMIDLPEETGNLRLELGIPEEAIVFGRHGGFETFNLPEVHRVIETVAEIGTVNQRPAYFLFLNTAKFTQKDYPNLLFLPKTGDRRRIVQFINSCDAMIHARKDGETFGLSVAEFSTLNKPVITTDSGDKAHLHFLGDQKLFYQNADELKQILTSFDLDEIRQKDWNAYRDFQPKAVMEKFQAVFLNSGNQWADTYVINLDRRSDRLDHFEQRFPELAGKYTRVSATDGELLAELANDNRELRNRLNHLKTRFQNPYVMGCAFSHWTAWKMISRDQSLKENDLVLIFEDDVLKNENAQLDFEGDLTRILNNCNQSFEVIFLGGRPDKDFKPIKSLDDWSMITDRMFVRPNQRTDPYEFDRGAYSYMITKSAARKLITDSLDLFSLPVDHWIMEKFRKTQMKTAEVFSHLCTSPLEYDTDIIDREKRTKLNNFLKPTIKVAYCDLWHEVEGSPLTVKDMNDRDYYQKAKLSRNLIRIDKGVGLTYFTYLKDLLKADYYLELVKDVSSAELVIASIFSNDKNQANSKAKVIVLDYEPPKKKLNPTHYVLSARPSHHRFIYLPLFVHHWGFEIIQKLRTKPQTRPKTKFCLCIVKNQSCRFRNNFVRELMTYQTVDCYGDLFKNCSHPIIETSSWTDPRLEDIIKDYKFMITFENCSAAGYHTEKIVMAMKANTIPIYWGDPNINQVFNCQSFINVTELGVNPALAKIKELDQNTDQYQAMFQEPWLAENSLLNNCTMGNYLEIFKNILS